MKPSLPRGETPVAESDSWGSTSGPELPFGHKQGWALAALQGGEAVVTAPGYVEGLSCTQDCVSQRDCLWQGHF